MTEQEFKEKLENRKLTYEEEFIKKAMDSGIGFNQAKFLWENCKYHGSSGISYDIW